jgi:enoyl-CoA hydratase/carnithine racemase
VQTGAKLVGYNDALAASAASYIILACDEVVTAPNALWMIHNAWAFLSGDADAFRAAASTLDKISADYVRVYAAQTGKSATTIRGLMNAESWLSAKEALDLGLTDSIASPGQQQTATVPAATAPSSSAKSPAQLQAEIKAIWHRCTASGQAAWKIDRMKARTDRTESARLADEMRRLVQRARKNLPGD